MTSSPKQVSPPMCDSKENCPVCLEEMTSSERIKELRCGHRMHYACFLYFTGNTNGTWVHHPGRIDPNGVGKASMGLCLSCPLCRDYSPYVYISDSDTTLEFRVMFMELTALGAKLTFCEMQCFLHDYKTSGLPIKAFIEKLSIGDVFNEESEISS